MKTKKYIIIGYSYKGKPKVGCWLEPHIYNTERKAIRCCINAGLHCPQYGYIVGTVTFKKEDLLIKNIEKEIKNGKVLSN